MWDYGRTPRKAHGVAGFIASTSHLEFNSSGSSMAIVISPLLPSAEGHPSTAKYYYLVQP
jgi:hypothetical protein